MLKLKDIKKTYVLSSDMQVHALKGINLCFRKNEFVSILGPSGCGKTTLLNIIGGLDKYTSGDLVISGRSTKEYNDRDWDIYRNHRIGFIFQSYNLIPHQTILGNVELALTISGVSKQERIEKAKKALDRVGLGGQYNKKPNQLSGGQCQRVAIARALVNEPEILLADEPTGALDTQTSVQIMDLIKEISAERLVIMVTHNPDLAYKYSTRIVNLLDGELQNDSNPFSEEEEAKEILDVNNAEDARINSLDEEERKKEIKQKNRAKMSFITAFKLSTRNLFSKLKRTILVMVAGSIGIIGVSAVLSVSTGVHDYIDAMQDDLLSGNPIKVTKSGIDYETMLDSSSLAQKSDAVKEGTKDGYVNINSIIDYLVSHEDALQELVYNNKFDMNYINYLKSMPKEYYQEIKLNYGIDVTPNVYTDFKVFKDGESLKYHSTADINLTNKYSRRISLNAITETYTAMLEETPYAQYSSYITSLATVMSQGVSNTEYVASQYDVLYGDLSNFGKKDPHSIIVVLSSDKKLSDLLLAQLGYFTEDEFYNMIFKASPEQMEGEYKEELNRTSYSYEEIANKKFYWYPNDTIYQDQSITSGDTFIHRYPYQIVAQDDWTNGVELKVAAIVKPKGNVSYGSLSSGFMYSEDFAREMVSKNINSSIAKNIREKGNVTSMPYTVPGMGVNIDIGIYYDLYYPYYDTDARVYKENVKRIYVGKNESGLMSTFMAYIGSGTKIGGGAGGSSSGGTGGIADILASMKTMDLNGVAGSYLPTSISIYPNNFETKYLVTDYLDAWNKEDKVVTFNNYNEDFTTVNGTSSLTYAQRTADSGKIKYTDSVEIIINLINTMINIVTYALVAFTALALVVSTVMVAIITYVSVVERIKEIGVIRALGGRKRDVSYLFNAETFIIGLSSGVFGIIITGLISLLANVLVKVASQGRVASIAHLTIPTSLIMILLSVVLTSIAGLIPARSAARKDPVVALRTE